MKSAAIAYVNGEFLPEAEAKVSIFDRGFLFADGVYEVIPIIEGRLADVASHRERLARSLREIKMAPPLPLASIDTLQRELVELNGITEGRLYLQISRGSAERDFALPSHCEPSLVMFVRQVPVLESAMAKRGMRVMTLPDNRWGRRDIKTVMLLPASLAKQQALDQGYDDAWFVQDGEVTEGTSNNAYIVVGEKIRTRPASHLILGGCTRKALLALADEQDVEVVERPFTPKEAYEADEAFVTSATTFVTPVVNIDGHSIGSGEPGPISRRLRELYIDYLRRAAEE